MTGADDSRVPNGPGRPTKLLVCTAHPDDETLVACTLAELAAAGVHVTLISATAGGSGTVRQPGLLNGRDLTEVRSDELRRSAELIGVADLRILDHVDGDVRSSAERLRDELATAIDEVRPDAVLSFGPDGVTGNPDHVVVAATALAVATAADCPMLQFGLTSDRVQRLLELFVTAYREAGRDMASLDDPRLREGLRATANRSTTADGYDLRRDCRGRLDVKAATMDCHATQPAMDLPRTHPEDFAEIFADEFFREVVGQAPAALASLTVPAHP